MKIDLRSAALGTVAVAIGGQVVMWLIDAADAPAPPRVADSAQVTAAIAAASPCERAALEAALAGGRALTDQDLALARQRCASAPPSSVSGTPPSNLVQQPKALLDTVDALGKVIR